jgi:hypothetical protein
MCLLDIQILNFDPKKQQAHRVNLSRGFPDRGHGVSMMLCPESIRYAARLDCFVLSFHSVCFVDTSIVTLGYGPEQPQPTSNVKDIKDANDTRYHHSTVFSPLFVSLFTILTSFFLFAPPQDFF